VDLWYGRDVSLLVDEHYKLNSFVLELNKEDQTF
jgi:hypothetical protein